MSHQFCHELNYLIHVCVCVETHFDTIHGFHIATRLSAPCGDVGGVVGWLPSPLTRVELGSRSLRCFSTRCSFPSPPIGSPVRRCAHDRRRWPGSGLCYPWPLEDSAGVLAGCLAAWLPACRGPIPRVVDVCIPSPVPEEVGKRPRPGRACTPALTGFHFSSTTFLSRPVEFSRRSFTPTSCGRGRELDAPHLPAHPGALSCPRCSCDPVNKERGKDAWESRLPEPRKENQIRLRAREAGVRGVGAGVLLEVEQERGDEAFITLLFYPQES